MKTARGEPASLVRRLVAAVRRASPICVPVVLVAVPWMLRGLLLAETGIAPAAADLAGFAADAGVAFGVAALLALLSRAPGPLRWGAVLPAVAWVLVAFASYEHVRALGAPLELTYAGYLADRTFLFGSVLASSRPLLLVAALALAILTVVGTVATAPRSSPHRLAVPGLAAAGVLLAAAGLVVPKDPEILAWRHQNPVLTWIVRGVAASPRAPREPAPAGPVSPVEADLAGEPRPGLGVAAGSRPNLLLVFLEGVSGAYLPSMAPGEAASAKSPMPGLDAWARRSTRVATFLAQQRQTNRGEYAALCGDLPDLTSGEPRLSRLARGELAGGGCLPAILRDRGWRTVYLQAAPLAFMLKDQAMRAMGFEAVEGEEAFPRSFAHSMWGVDDRAFFEQALHEVRRLQAERRSGGRPWFLTLLTAGTHHPYTLPEEAWNGAAPSLGAAMAYLDQAVAAFLAALEGEGVLEDTLVVLTSDESAGWSGDLGPWAAGDADRSLSQNHGLLLLFGAGAGTGGGVLIEEPHLQSDLPLSLLDLLGEVEAVVHLRGEDASRSSVPSPSGRSLRRRYPRPRPLAFANTYLRTVGLLDGDRLLECGEEAGDLVRCRAWRVDPRRPLAQPREPMEPSAEIVAELRRWITDDQARHAPAAGYESAPTVVELSGTEVVALHDAGAPQMIFGGQSLAATMGQQIDVDLELEVRGGPGWLHLRHALTSDGNYLYRPRLPVLGVGDRLHLRYSLTAAQPLPDLEVRLVANRLLGKELALGIRRARLTLASALPFGADGEPGRVRVETMQVDRRGDPPVLRLGLEDLEDPLPACVERQGVRLLAERCPPGEILAGPRFYAPEGSRVSVRYGLEGLGEAVDLTALLGAESPSLVLAQGRLPRLVEGERRTLAFTADVENVSLNELRFGLFADRESSLLIRDLAVEVVLP